MCTRFILFSRYVDKIYSILKLCEQDLFYFKVMWTKKSILKVCGQDLFYFRGMWTRFIQF